MELPEHIAIVPDGNRRWSHLHGVPKLQGHRVGAEKMHTAVEYLIGRKIKYLTLWGFSSDNWRRSDDEVSDLFDILALWIAKETPWLNREGVKLRHIGRLGELPRMLQDEITRAVDITKHNAGMTLNLAFNYTGRADIVDAVRRLIDTLLSGVSLDEPPALYVDESLISRYLSTEGMPDVDLIIRTAGEFRISNFFLWQAAYSEFYFTGVLWPDFNEEELEKALSAYGDRRRSFGGD